MLHDAGGYERYLWLMDQVDFRSLQGDEVNLHPHVSTVLSSHDRFPWRGSVDKDVLRKSGGSCSARDTEVTEQEGRVISVKR